MHHVVIRDGLLIETLSTTEWDHHDHFAGFANHGPAAEVLSNQAKVADQKKTVSVAFQSAHGDESHKKIWKAPVTAIVYATVKPGVSAADFEKGIQASKAVADSGASGLVSFDAGPVVGNPNEWVIAAGYTSIDVCIHLFFEPPSKADGTKKGCSPGQECHPELARSPSCRLDIRAHFL